MQAEALHDRQRLGAVEGEYHHADDGQVKEVDPEEVSIGDVLLIRAGEKIPVDAEVVEQLKQKFPRK